MQDIEQYLKELELKGIKGAQRFQWLLHFIGQSKYSTKPLLVH